MATLPASFKVKHENANSQEPSKTEIFPKPLKGCKLNHVYICQVHLDSKWTDSNLISWLERCGYVCAEYHRDVLIGEKVLDVMCNFLFTSDKTIIILSESFVKSGLMMYQLQLAVQYCIDHNCRNIITIHVDDCALPPPLLHFDYVKFDPKQDWRMRVKTFIDGKNKPMPKDFCTKDTHVCSIELFKTERSVISEPATLNSSKNSLRIPEHIKTKIKIWYKSKSIEDGFCNLALPKQEIADKISTSTDQGNILKEKKDECEPEAATTHLLGTDVQYKSEQVSEEAKRNLTGSDGELTVEEDEVGDVLEDIPIQTVRL